MSETSTCRLYLITPSVIDPGGFEGDLASALEAGDVACLQLRLKEADDETLRRAVQVCLPPCHDHGVALLINDRPDLAAELGADGTHVGQGDMHYKEARALVGPEAIVGVTCHDSRHLAMTAADRGADYVAFGAFFATRTKDTSVRADTVLLDWWRRTTNVPCVAVGGITAENCPPLVAAGADFLAVCGAVWSHPEGPGQAVRDFNTAISKAVADSPSRSD